MTDHDVVVVGGGPAGCSVGIFTARYGLDTLIFDRGRSSLAQCAFLENYPGFPGGIDVETFAALLTDHATEAGCSVVADLVASVTRADDEGFLVKTQSGPTVTARRVVAATRYGGEYLFDLDASMVERVEYGGEEDERFDRSYADADGRTSTEGLYVASPSDAADRQAIVAAGRGARVGIALVEDVRRERGYPEGIAPHYDWVRRESERAEEWSDRDRWREWFENALPDDHDLGDRHDDRREAEVDRRLDAYVSAAAVDRRAARGHERLLDSVDDEAILERARAIEADRDAERDGS